VLRAEAPRAVEAACVRRDGNAWVGLVGARHVDAVLSRIGKSYGVELGYDSAPEPGKMQERIVLSELGGLRLSARRSRVPMEASLRELDSKVLVIGGVTVTLALLLAALFSRGLSRPLVELARQASQVMQGEPRLIEASGPREVEEAAAAFNRAIGDLAQLRRSLAASERIAAWRETARHVAHEIKNPLAPIRAAIETLRRLRERGDPAFDEYFDEATRTALDEVGRINHIVSEFTRFARLPAPNPTELDVVEVVRSVVTLHASLGAEIALSHDPVLAIRADRDQLVQVVTNLLQNALDAVSGRTRPRVELELRAQAGDRVVIAVRDNGPGVPEELRPRLFQPYATGKAHGTGLGLAIAQRLVVEHGGDIEYRDVPRGGAEFRIVLPVGGPSGERAPA
jgi:nitrogen fixation/metabolism regulation signal transduction histidine kinase